MSPFTATIVVIINFYDSQEKFVSNVWVLVFRCTTRVAPGIAVRMSGSNLGCSVPEKRRLSMCMGCGSQIHDQYILRVAPDLEWHAACLKCTECHQFLDENCTCFVKDGKTYCKRDYVRWVGIFGIYLEVLHVVHVHVGLCRIHRWFVFNFEFDNNWEKLKKRKVGVNQCKELFLCRIKIMLNGMLFDV